MQSWHTNELTEPKSPEWASARVAQFWRRPATLSVMSIFGRKTVTLLAATFLLAGFSQTTRTASETRPVRARLITVEAIRIAQQAAERDAVT
jgi:hypothetical protein